MDYRNDCAKVGLFERKCPKCISKLGLRSYKFIFRLFTLLTELLGTYHFGNRILLSSNVRCESGCS